MITLGIDLSSMAKGTAACRVHWLGDRAVADPPVLQCEDARLDLLIRGDTQNPQADAIGIDAPFGWPAAFVTAVRNWTIDSWNEEIRDELRFRETDRVVCQRPDLQPLSVSADRIALPAMRAMALLVRHHVKDKSGDGRFFEVYPAGSLSSWGFRCRGYKKITEECMSFRKDILNTLQNALPWLEVPAAYADSSDSLDALIASLTARAAFQNNSLKPDETQKTLARREGWIHLPQSLPTL